MTITLHWWAAPIFLMLLGAFVAWLDARNDSGMFAEFFGGLFMIAMFLQRSHFALVIGWHR